MFGISWKTIREVVMSITIITAMLTFAVATLSGCTTLPRCIIDTMTPPCSDEDGLVHNRMVENAKRINEDSMRRIREAWTGIVIVGMERDFKKKELAVVQSFDSRTNTWGSHILRQSEMKQGATGDYRSFAVPEHFASFLPIRAVKLWKKPLYGKYTVTFELEFKNEDSGETCRIESASDELISSMGMTPCMGVCGRIFKIRLEGEPLHMEPYRTCLRMLKRE